MPRTGLKTKGFQAIGELLGYCPKLVSRPNGLRHGLEPVS